MINGVGMIEVPVGYSFNDGNNIYRAVTPHDCCVCALKDRWVGHYPCFYIACCGSERSDGKGVHFIKVGGEE